MITLITHLFNSFTVQDTTFITEMMDLLCCSQDSCILYQNNTGLQMDENLNDVTSNLKLYPTIEKPRMNIFTTVMESQQSPEISIG